METATQTKKRKTEPSQRKWISVSEGARILEMGAGYVRRIALGGQLPYRVLPGRKGVQIERAAVERIAQEAVRQPVGA